MNRVHLSATCYRKLADLLAVRVSSAIFWQLPKAVVLAWQGWPWLRTEAREGIKRITNQPSFRRSPWVAHEDFRTRPASNIYECRDVVRNHLAAVER